MGGEGREAHPEPPPLCKAAQRATGGAGKEGGASFRASVGGETGSRAGEERVKPASRHRLGDGGGGRTLPCASGFRASKERAEAPARAGRTPVGPRGEGPPRAGARPGPSDHPTSQGRPRPWAAGGAGGGAPGRAGPTMDRGARGPRALLPPEQQTSPPPARRADRRALSATRPDAAGPAPEAPDLGPRPRPTPARAEGGQRRAGARPGPGEGPGEGPWQERRRLSTVPAPTPRSGPETSGGACSGRPLARPTGPLR